MHVTLDYQALWSGLEASDTAHVLGVRIKLDF